MAIISSGNLQTVLDKMARWAAEAAGDSQVVTTPNAGIVIANTDVLAALETTIDGLTDNDQNADLLPAIRDLGDSAPALNYFGAAAWAGMLDAFDRHARRYGYADLNAYLSFLNVTTPALRVHNDFSKYLGRVRSPNVFIPVDTDLARIDITGAAAGTFVDIAAIDTTLYGGAKLVAKNNGALTTNPVLSVTVMNLITGASQVLTVTTGSLSDGAETDLSDTTKKFWDVTNITVTSDGTGGNSVKIVAKTDRSITAA